MEDLYSLIQYVVFIFGFFSVVIAPVVVAALLVIHFFDSRKKLRDAREQERQNPGSVPPQELRNHRLRYALSIATPLALAGGFYVYTVLLGRPILAM